MVEYFMCSFATGVSYATKLNDVERSVSTLKIMYVRNANEMLLPRRIAQSSLAVFSLQIVSLTF